MSTQSVSLSALTSKDSDILGRFKVRCYSRKEIESAADFSVADFSSCSIRNVSDKIHNCLTASSRTHGIMRMIMIFSPSAAQGTKGPAVAGNSWQIYCNDLFMVYLSSSNFTLPRRTNWPDRCIHAVTKSTSLVGH